ncbi:ATP-binding protein [Streptomyces virginiae]|uniref:ATP-binding protein n=1 Tax=Streptomyces virginiae TaxID=1961 RepID=UPI003869DD2D
MQSSRVRPTEMGVAMRQMIFGAPPASSSSDSRSAGADDLLECALTMEGPGGGTHPAIADTRWVGQARTAVTARLQREGLDNLLDPVRLIVSELVTNAIRHGSRFVTLSLRTTPAELQLCVRDGGRGIPQAVAQDADAESGRGVWIVGLVVAELGGTWGYALDSRIAWCVLPLTGLPRPELAAPQPLPASGGNTVSETDPHDYVNRRTPPSPSGRPARPRSVPRPVCHCPISRPRPWIRSNDGPPRRIGPVGPDSAVGGRAVARRTPDADRCAP